jgi:hypothetical protein
MITQNNPYYFSWEPKPWLISIKSINYAFIHENTCDDEFIHLDNFIKLGGKVTLTFTTTNLSNHTLNYYKTILEKINVSGIDFIFEETYFHEPTYRNHANIIKELVYIYQNLQVSITVLCTENGFNNKNLKMVQYYKKQLSLTFINCLFNNDDIQITNILKGTTIIKNKLNVPFYNLGLVIRYSNLNSILQLSKLILKHNVIYGSITYWGLQLDEKFQVFDIINNIAVVQKNLIEKVFL